MANETSAPSDTGNMMLSKIILSVKCFFVYEVWFSLFFLWQYQLNGASCSTGRVSVCCPLYVGTAGVLKFGSEIFPDGQYCFVVRHTGARLILSYSFSTRKNEDENGICRITGLLRGEWRNLRFTKDLEWLAQNTCCLSIRLVSKLCSPELQPTRADELSHQMLLCVLSSHTLQRPLGLPIVLG